MPKSVLFQGLTGDTHLSAVRDVLEVPDPERVLLSVAFTTERGLSALRAALAPVAPMTTIVTGIRNGITSAQGLNMSLELGCATYAVDTGTRSVLFHPKVYLSWNAVEARLVVGSANLTIGGLNSNIEASVLMTLDLANPDDAEMVQRLAEQLDDMIAEYPANVFPVDDVHVIENLFAAGLVIDESKVIVPSTAGSSRNRDLDTTPRMVLQTRAISRPRVRAFDVPLGDAPEPVPGGPAGPVAVARERLTLVWRSNPLKRRDLTIPAGAVTNPTGSMLFKVGAFTDIDQRHYFRDDVFADLEWAPDERPARQHLERAEAQFKFIIKDIEYATFSLRLTHNTRMDTPAYRQRNGMTQLHWGEARRLISREDLLERTMYLFRDDVDTRFFVIAID